METLDYTILRESNPEEMEIEAITDNYDTFLSMKNQPMATKTLVQSFVNGDDELHSRMGLHKDTYWCNIEEMTPNGHDIDEDLYDDQTLEHGFHQSSKSDRPLDVRNCILLDSESTVYAFCNANFVEDIWHSH